MQANSGNDDRGSVSTEAPPLQKIGHKALKDKVVEQLKAAMYRGVLRPGERLTELGIAAQLGVGQPTVREALIVLEHEGFVEKKGPRKTYVTSLTESQIQDIYSVRERLEQLAVEILCSRSGLRLDGPASSCRDMLAAAEVGDMNAFYAADLEFHRGLWRATGNAALRDSLERLVPKLFAFAIIRQAAKSNEDFEQIALTHQALLTAICRRDFATVGSLLAESMKRAYVDDAALLKNDVL